MAKRYQLGGDPHTTPASGDASVQTPDSNYPKLPETDYHHDQGADNRRSPGPYAGDDLVSQQEDQHIRDETLVYSDPQEVLWGNEFPPAKPRPVDVKVVDSNKTVKITHQLTAYHIVTMGTVTIPKDPTRTKLKLIEQSSQGVYIVPDTSAAARAFPDNITSVAAWQLAQQAATGISPPFETASEEPIILFNSGGNVATVLAWAEFQRGINSREEYYDGQ